MYTHEFVAGFPMLEELALKLKVHPDTIQEWKKVHFEFSVLISELLSKQAVMIARAGMVGLYNPVIAKVFLTKHGYREGHEHSNPDGTNLFRPTDAERDRAAQALRELPPG